MTQSEVPTARPVSDGMSAIPTPLWRDAVATLHPASFAMVMATGILSVACQLLGWRSLAVVLLWINAVLYGSLAALTGWRIVSFRDRFTADLLHHGRAVGFFTTVAATCVLGSQTLLITGAWRVAAGLWIGGIVLWALVTYTVFTVLTVKSEKPALAEGINGSWLIGVVAAQSVSVLGTQLSEHFDYSPALVLFCLGLWLGGGMLYIWIISLIFYRYIFFAMSPADLAPPYWINMGAVAISTLAGTALAGVAPHSLLLTGLLPFLTGFTLLFWATATWWIPMLVILGIWRHLVRRFPLRYDPLYWGAVFPLGMYAVATLRLVGMIDAPFLMFIPQLFFFAALAAWALTMTGLVRRIAGLSAP